MPAAGSSAPKPSMAEILETVRRIIKEDDARPGSAAAIGDGDDILELTEALNDDGTTRSLAPVGPSAQRAPALREPVLAVPRPDEAAARREPALVAGRALEEVVADLLRPMLQRWLDEHLPEIVERLAKGEVARAVGKSGAA